MTVTEYLRHPVLLLAAVSLAIALVWFALGYPVEMPRSPMAEGEKLDCVSYAPLSVDPDSDAKAIDAARIEADLRRLAPHVSCVRTYATGFGLDRVPELARPLGLSVLQGLAIGRDETRNRAEVERAVALARTQRPAIRAFVVGNEVLSRGDLTSAELGALVRRVRAATRIPATYADRWEAWLNAAELASHVDFVTIHVPLYDAPYAVPAPRAVPTLREVRGRVAARVGKKEIMVGEIGWPSDGRMRDAARPSPANQARVLHELVTAAKADKFRFSIFEGLDQAWRQRIGGTAAGHWGLQNAENGAFKFRWGRPVSNHPVWFAQGILGILLAFIVFAAAFLATRSRGPQGPAAADWRPVAVIALAAGLFIGWAVADAPLQSPSIVDWVRTAILIALAAVTPPIAVAAVLRTTPFESLDGVFGPPQRRATQPLGRALGVLFILVLIAAIQIGLCLVFDPEGRDFPFAPLSGPAVALLVAVLRNPRRPRQDGIAESVAAAVLAGCAVVIVVNETVWNWQAAWLAAVLLALAAVCWRARGAQSL